VRHDAGGNARAHLYFSGKDLLPNEP
jgi:hypothetical protein